LQGSAFCELKIKILFVGLNISIKKKVRILPSLDEILAKFTR